MAPPADQTHDQAPPMQMSPPPGFLQPPVSQNPPHGAGAGLFTADRGTTRLFATRLPATRRGRAAGINVVQSWPSIHPRTSRERSRPLRVVQACQTIPSATAHRGSARAMP
jgi:hypothetical protein